MNSPDVLLALTEAEIGREIVRLIPHWYQAECGPEEYSIPIGGHTSRFFNHCRLTPTLKAFLGRVCARTRELPLHHFIQLPSLIDVLLESLAIEWLRMHSSDIDWVRLIKYLETVARRTYENHPVSLALIVKSGEGTADVSQPHLQKFFDRLAASSFSYLTVDPDLRLIDYDEVEWSQIDNAASYKFHPEFLHPIHCVLGEREFSAHLTTQGDLIVMNKGGLLAARRKRKWKLYDVRTFKNGLAYCLGNAQVGANLFEVIFDLSFRRQGALLIYDPKHQMRERILNADSILYPGWLPAGQPDPGRVFGQTLIAPCTADIAVGKKAGSLRRKRRLVEMATVDGAIIFDDHRLLAVGALVRSHPSVGSQLGARTTAARSAYLWGAHPIKVSSDGDVTIHFQSVKGDATCDAVMHFL